jgi:hypothetical protein
MPSASPGGRPDGEGVRSVQLVSPKSGRALFSVYHSRMNKGWSALFSFFVTAIEPCNQAWPGFIFSLAHGTSAAGFYFHSLRGIKEARRFNRLASDSLVFFLFRFPIATSACMAVLFFFIFSPPPSLIVFQTINYYSA